MRVSFADKIIYDNAQYGVEIYIHFNPFHGGMFDYQFYITAKEDDMFRYAGGTEKFYVDYCANTTGTLVFDVDDLCNKCIK